MKEDGGPLTLARPTTGTVTLTGDDLSIEEVVRIARRGARVEISCEALDRVRRARDVVDRVLERGDLVYGMNTGVGSLSRYRIPFENLEQFSVRLVTRHTTHQGADLKTSVVRAMMATRANGMAKGGVGVRAELIQAFLDVLNAGVHPVVRTGGSVGQGDLAEMAEIGQVLIGRGEADFEGRRLPGAEALKAAGLEPIHLKAKEGLALISANGVTMGHGSLVLADVADLLDAFDVTAALSLEAFGGNLSTIHPEATRMRPHPGQSRAAGRLRELLDGSYLWRPGAARNLQDPLSFRCVPQTHGACYDAHAYSRGTMEVEINSASDNPLVLLDDQSIISVSNFDVVALAVAFDLLRVAVAQVVHLANERIQKHLWSQFSGLPTGLAARDGDEGLRPLGYTSASLAAEARVLANPVSLDYRGQIAEGIEDHASMAPLGVRKTEELLFIARRTAALELTVATRAIDMRGNPPLGAGTEIARDIAREFAATDPEERWPDVDGLTQTIDSGRLVARVASEIGPLEPVSTTGDAVGPAESRE
jgi:histidine ammonia-lyase